MSHGDKTTNPAAGSGGTPAACATAPCPLAVSVVINLSQPVACPGHPLSVIAVGTPGGGTYKWVVAGAELVDGAGHPKSDGDTVFMRGFKADDATGKIPERTVNLTVRYTHPNGPASATKPVKIHKIDFTITDEGITKGLTQANEGADIVNLEAFNIQTMATDPKVKIQLDASCPRKTDCAKNHRVGWLQTLILVDRRARYTHTLIEAVKTHALPLRDGDPFAGPSPHPFYDAAFDFTGDNDTRTAHHFDSPKAIPGEGVPWTDPRAGAPPPPPPQNQQLRQIFFKIGFHAWLVVQNKEWSLHDLPGSFAYQRHFDWSIHFDVAVNTSATGNKCTPHSSVPTISAMAPGKGGASPSLMHECSNDFNQVNPPAAAPGI